jgi:hypothetical protein
MKSFPVFILISVSLVNTICLAQSSIGLSINNGDRVIFTPSYSNLFWRKSFLTPTIVFAHQIRSNSGFSIVFEAQAGLTQYYVAPIAHDTIDFNPSGPSLLMTEMLFVSRIGATPGVTIKSGEKDLFIGLGGGLSYHVGEWSDELNIFKIDNGVRYKVFSAVTAVPKHGALGAYANAQVRVALSERITFSFQYIRTFRSVFSGDFSFYHTPEPASGTYKFVPKGVSFQFLYQLRKT